MQSHRGLGTELAGILPFSARCLLWIEGFCSGTRAFSWKGCFQHCGHCWWWLGRRLGHLENLYLSRATEEEDSSASPCDHEQSRKQIMECSLV